jgi:hypothetical protein
MIIRKKALAKTRALYFNNKSEQLLYQLMSTDYSPKKG